MCFSALISFSAAAGLSCLGIATIRQTTSKQELLLASFPCLFALQQTCEGLVWLGQQHNYNYFGIDSVGIYGFLLFATFLWLVLSPLSIYLLEEDPQCRRLLLGLTVAGFGLGIYLFSWVVYDGVEPQLFSGNLVYDLQMIPGYEISKYLYLVIVSLPFLISRSSSLKLFGLLLVISFLVSQLFFQAALVSIWCFFAALLSGFIYSILKNSSVDRPI